MSFDARQKPLRPLVTQDVTFITSPPHLGQRNVYGTEEDR